MDYGRVLIVVARMKFTILATFQWAAQRQYGHNIVPPVLPFYIVFLFSVISD